MNDFDWPPREPIDGVDVKDRATPDQRTEIVWLQEDESALDAFASESDLVDIDVTAPSPAATTDRPKVPSDRPGVASAAPSISIPVQTIEPVRAPAIETIRVYPIDPVQDYQIDSARNVAIEPSLAARRGSRRTPGTSLLQRCAVFVVLALGVLGGGMAGLYLRRNPLDLAIIQLPLGDGDNQTTTAVPAPETSAPPANGDPRAPAATAQPVTPAAGPPSTPGNPEVPLAPPPAVQTIPSAAASSTRPETPAPAPPRAAADNLVPPSDAVTPAPVPPPRIDALTTAGDATSTRERTADGEAPSPSQPTPPVAPGEASVVAPPAAAPATPDAGPSSTTDRVRVTDATPGVAEAADEQRIAAVLKRFTDAYAQLDAPAAKAVWPSVDGRALSRAFDALESQSIEFDDCTVHFAGAEARAACVGNITYVPKIGRRSARTLNRQWNFVMKRSSDGWMIADARMR